MLVLATHEKDISTFLWIITELLYFAYKFTEHYPGIKCNSKWQEYEIFITTNIQIISRSNLCAECVLCQWLVKAYYNIMNISILNH